MSTVTGLDPVATGSPLVPGGPRGKAQPRDGSTGTAVTVPGTTPTSPFTPVIPGTPGHGTVGPSGYREGPTVFQQYPQAQVYDFPTFGGPYSAPLTGGQVDALQGFNRLANPGQTFTDTRDLLSTIQLGLTGQPQGLNAENVGQIDPRRSLEESLFQQDLDRRLAEIREGYSGLGLGPGSTDRSQGLAREALQQSGQFRLGQMRNQQEAAFQALPHLFQLENLPFNRAQQQYGLNEAARQVADIEAQRRAAENARVQGTGLQQVLSLISGIPLQNTTVGPSPLSQASGLLGGAGTAIAAGK